jgi:hypothetical protein
MKKIVVLAGLVALAACNKQPDPVQPIDQATLLPQEEVELLGNAQSPTGNMTEEELDQSSSDMMNQQAADEAAERASYPFEVVGSEADAGVYIYRDKATGCEFLEKEDSSYKTGMALVFIPRPDGKGGQRGCRTGTDFKK